MVANADGSACGPDDSSGTYRCCLHFLPLWRISGAHSMADIAPAQGLGFSVRDLLRIAPPVADNFFGDIVFSYRGGSEGCEGNGGCDSR